MISLTPGARQTGLTAAVVAWAVLLSLAQGWIARAIGTGEPAAGPQEPVASLPYSAEDVEIDAGGLLLVDLSVRGRKMVPRTGIEPVTP